MTTIILNSTSGFIEMDGLAREPVFIEAQVIENTISVRYNKEYNREYLLMLTHASNIQYQEGGVMKTGTVYQIEAAINSFKSSHSGGGSSLTNITDATRPDVGVANELYFNSDSNKYEEYVGGVWQEAAFSPLSVPSTPSSITPNPGNNQITESFTSSAGASSYEVQASSVLDFSAISGTKTGASSPLVINSGVSNGTPYYSRVRGVSSRGIKGSWRTAAGTVTPLLSASTYLMAADGDSQTAGQNGLESWFNNMATDYAGNANYVGWYNEAWPGEFTHASLIDSHYDASKTKNMLFLYTGINRIHVGQTGAGLYAEVKAYIQARLAVGWTVIPYTLCYSKFVASGVPSVSALAAEVTAFNNLMISGYSSDIGCDILVDVQTSTAIGGVNAADTLGVFHSDKLHFAPAGEKAMQQLGQLALNATVANQTGIISAPQFTGTFTTTHKPDHDFSFFTHYGTAEVGGWGAGASPNYAPSFRDGDLININPVTMDSGVTFNVVTKGAVEEGVKFYAELTDSINSELRYRVDGGAWNTPLADARSGAYPFPYLIRGLGDAGSHTVDIQCHLKSGSSSAGQYIFDGAEIYQWI